MTNRQVEGVDLTQLEEQYAAFELAVLAAIKATMRKAVKDEAVAGTLARLSLDDLNVIPPLWAARVPELAAAVQAAFVDAANQQLLAYEGATGNVVHDMWTSEHAAAADYLSQATNRLVGIGDDLWADARSELLTGLTLGEDIGTIAGRVRKSIDVTAPRATMIARTEIVGSSSAGSIAFMRATGEVASKTWIHTSDARCRPSHVAAGGQTVDLNAKFIVGGALLDHPGDPNGPASQTANCRCCLGYLLHPDSAENQVDGGSLAASAQEDAVTMTDEHVESESVTELDALVAAMDPANTTAWAGVLCVDGARTGDHREFVNLSWGNLPMPLQWQKVSSHGGVPTDETVLVGRIDTITKNGNEIYATGLIDLGSVDGREAARLMGTRTDPAFLSGVSIVGDDPNNGLVEVIFPAGCGGLDMSPADMLRCSEPEVVIYHDTRIRAATLCDVPAIMTGQLYLTSTEAIAPGNMPANMPVEEMAMAASISADEPTMADVVESLTAAAATIVIPDLPPAWWFDEPEVPEIGGITITDEGRIFGYLATTGVQHRSYAGSGKRVTVPMGKVDYSRFMNRATIVADDDGTNRRIATGPVTMSCGHAPTTGPLARSSAASMEVYDNSCSIFATICVGENRGGVWVAGAVLPDVTASQLARALACQLSGDWRQHSDRQGWREMIAALMVPCPGFPVANRGARVSMQGDALVASAVPVNFSGETECAPCADIGESGGGVSSLASVRAADILSAKVGRDRVSRAAELTRLVRG